MCLHDLDANKVFELGQTQANYMYKKTSCLKIDLEA